MKFKKTPLPCNMYRLANEIDIIEVQLEILKKNTPKYQVNTII